MRNDILVNMNKQRVTLLVFLELSPAFDTVDHDILLRRLEYKFGIKDQSLIWFRSYLLNRSQRIVIGNVKSDSFDLKFGVPQGICLAKCCSPFTPVSYLMWLASTRQQRLVRPTIPLSLWLNRNDDSDQDTAIAAMEACLCDIRNWTEFMFIGTKAQLQKIKRGYSNYWQIHHLSEHGTP